ncbi:MAG: SDR family oxidoreductase [Elsteraceae bacterium]
MEINVSGLRVVVTAGAGGAGFGIAEGFSAGGARVAVCDVDEQALAAVREKHPDWIVMAADVGDEADVDRFFDKVLGDFGGLDALVNNAGIAGPVKEPELETPAEWDRTLGVNLRGPFLCARRAIPAMKAAKKGAIINIASTSARTGLPRRLPYVVSKAGVMSLTHNLARELGGFGIRVNSILPGAIRGERIQRVINAKSEALGVSAADYERDMLRFISMGVMVDPADLAAMAMFLASPAGRFVSGQQIGVCGDFQHEE